MKTRIYAMLTATVMSVLGMMATNSYGIPEKIQDGNILHCFDWTFTDIKNELPAIAGAGFGAIQVSPVQGNCGSNAEWFYAYMPYDLKFRQNGNGSSTRLKQLCEEAEKYGIKIIVDVVANHVNQGKGYHDTWWDSNGRVRWNGGINYSDRNSVTHNQLGEYGDINSEDAEVQARAKAFVEELKALGVKGIRWDAAKHIALPSEQCRFWSTVTSVPGMWHYGEILDGPGGSNKYGLLKEYTDYIGVTDTEYSNWTLSQIKSGQVPTGHGSWTANGVPSASVIYWGESHDDYSNDGRKTTNVAQDKIDRAYAIGACRAGEAALYFSRPSATTRTTIRMGAKGSTHFTAPEVAEVNKFRNAMVGRADYYSHSGGVACITRQGGGACIVVGAGGSRDVSVPNGGSYTPAGQYKDRISGNTFTVTASTITGKVGPTGIAVIYGDLQPIDPDPVIPPTPEGQYVYLNNNWGWSTPCVWAWTDSGNCNYNGTWPGDKMTKEGSLWIWRAPDGKYPTKIIFSNNGSPQTADLDYHNTYIYSCDGSSVTGVEDITDQDTDEAPAVYYNLQGVRTDTPAPGSVYIRVQSGRATKVAL